MREWGDPWDVAGVPMPDRKLSYAPLRPVAPADVGAHWPHIRQGLEYLQQFGTEWGPEHIFHALLTGDAVLLIGTGGDGFLVVSQRQDWAGKILWVWCAYGAPGANIAKYWRDVKTFARASGATRIMFSSARPGWARKAALYGFKKTRMIPYIATI